MIFIKKGSEPVGLKLYRKMEMASFDGMDTEVKRALRQSLLKEQGYLCAYCMSRIKEDRDVKIEHFSARTPENELDYRNLLAVCKGNEGSPRREQTCDTRKGNLVLHVNPLSRYDMDQIYYFPHSGEVHSKDPEADKDIEAVLNLNCPNGYLIENRKAAINPIRQKLYQLRESNERIRILLHKLKESYEAETEEKTPYAGIILYYIDKKLAALS